MAWAPRTRPRSGLAAAKEITGVQGDLTRIHRGFPAPKKPPPLTLIGARAMLALRERRAGIE